MTQSLSKSNEIDKIAVISSDKTEKCDCNDPNNYAPDERFPLFDDIKYIRLNFHYPNASNLQYNYTGADAVRYAKDLINTGNGKLSRNLKMNLPEGNDIPVYDTGYRYVLGIDDNTPSGFAVYEDIDDENWFYIKKGKGKNNYSKTIIKKFAVEDDTHLNIFAMAYPPDSIGRKGFSAGRAGIALGNSLKIAGIKKHGVSGAWRFAALMNHEVGHVFGLRHSWYKNDGCEDTPPNPNCWSKAKNGEGPCAGVISNNMMDYNNQQMAITPCQIGMVKKNMHREKSKVRGLLVKDWCEYNPEKSLYITKDVNIDRAIDMKGDIIIKEDKTLRLSCRTHMPIGGRIIIYPGAKLVLNGAKIHNDCGETWDGFVILTKGDKTGSIEYLGEVDIQNLVDDPKTDEKE